MKRLALIMVMLGAVLAVSSCTADEDQVRLIAGIGEAGPSGNRSTNRLLWTRHSSRGAKANVTVELAVAADGADAHLAALFARRDEVDRLVETVLLPALDSFVPGPPDAAASILASTPPDPDYWPTDGWRRASAASQGTTDGVADPIYEYGYQWWLDRADGYAYMAGRFGQLAFVAPDADLVAVLTAHLPENMSQGVPRWLFERYVLPAAERR